MTLALPFVAARTLGQLEMASFVGEDCLDYPGSITPASTDRVMWVILQLLAESLLPSFLLPSKAWEKVLRPVRPKESSGGWLGRCWLKRSEFPRVPCRLQRLSQHGGVRYSFSACRPSLWLIGHGVLTWLDWDWTGGKEKKMAHQRQFQYYCCTTESLFHLAVSRDTFWRREKIEFKWINNNRNF